MTAAPEHRLGNRRIAVTQDEQVAGGRFDREWCLERRRESQRDFGRTVEVCGEQSRRHPTVPAVGGSGEPRGDHDRLDDHRVMMTDARLGALRCGLR